jgi:TonB family protein
MGRGDLATPSIRFRGSTCDPEFVLDGLVLGPAVFDIDAVAPGTIEGIEIYSGPSTVPVEFKRAGLGSRNGCGMIVVWTRRGEPRARSRRKPRAPITAAALAALVEGASVFTADQVDVAATPKGDLSALIPYPESLRGADRVTASAVVEFVVDTGGAVEGATINFVSVPAPAFAAVLRASTPELRFTPARRSGVAVRQVVQLAVQFDPAAKPAAERSPE